MTVLTDSLTPPKRRKRRFVVYEVWTKATIVEAADESEAYKLSQPTLPDPNTLSLSNWHAVEITEGGL